jgi:hypothetical protein
MTEVQRRRIDHRARQRKYRQNNRDRIKKLKRASRIRCRSINRDRKLTLKRLHDTRYRQKHRDELRERMKAYQKVYRQKHRNAIRERSKVTRKIYRQKYPVHIAFCKWAQRGNVKISLLDSEIRRALESAYQRKLLAVNTLRQIKTLQQNKGNSR